MLAVRCRILPQRPIWRTIEKVQGGFALPPRQGLHPWLGFRAVPIRPIWPGFAVNTLFYAAVLWALVCGRFALRRLIRLKRGLCPNCAYSTGESDVCSECGRALPQRAEVVT